MHTLSFSRKQRFNIGFLAGLIAGIIASILMLLLSVIAHGVSLPEAVGALFTQLMPISAFDYLHQTLGLDAKYYLLDGIIVGQCLVFALCGGLCYLLVAVPKYNDRFHNGTGQLKYIVGVLLFLILWLFTGLIFLPLTGAGIFGANLNSGIANSIWSLGVIGLIFALCFIFFQRQLVLHPTWFQGKEKSLDGEPLHSTRRTIIRRGVVVLGLGVLGVVAWRIIVGAGNAGAAMQASTNQILQQFKSKITPPPKPNYGTVMPVSQLSSEVTSNSKYYVVSKNLVSDPSVDGKTWQLTVNGEVQQPYTLTYDELTALPMKQQYESMMCISNEVGGPYMSNALWEGIPLANLLAHAGGAKSGATKVVLHAADDYTDSIVLPKAMEATTLLAVRMNGVTLPQGHGYPARLLVPGIYGMKHVKWVTRIEVVKENFQGYWQQRGWSDPAPVRLTSRIDTPILFARLSAHKTTSISGVAFSGNKGISEVDVSVNGGTTWQRATLQQPHSDLTWVLWQLPWTTTPGSYTIVARAIDMEGNVQDPHEAPPLPDGSLGYHTINVTVS